MLTWQNGIGLESSGKIENLLERSLRKKKQKNDPKWMMGNTQDDNGRRFTLWTYSGENFESSRLERIYNPTG